MVKGIITVFSNPASTEQEAAFNEWYDTIHLDELRGVPGIVGAQRYRLSEGPGPAPDHRYLAVYELDRPASEVLGEMASHVTTMSPTLDRDGVRMVIWEPIPSRAQRG